MYLSIVFFLIYVLIVVVIGIISSRKESEDGFMIADRNIEGLQVAATMGAGFFDGATLSIYIAYVYLYGFSAMWMFVGLAVGFILAYLVAYLQHGYYFEIILPGSIVGMIVGYATQRYGAVPVPATR